MPELAPLPAGTELVASEIEVDAAYARLAASIQSAVAADDCVLLGLLLGGMVTLVQVAGRLRGDFELDVCHLGRYGDALTGGMLRWNSHPRVPLAGRCVIVVDDICDEGVTLAAVRAYCLEAGARRVLLAVLTRKRRLGCAVQPDFVGIEIDDRYVFGCGMDLHGRWRHLPALYALRSD